MNILGNHGYFNKKVPSISLPYFLKTIIHENLIDGLWIDAEGAEYSMLHHFYRNGPLDQHNITICQFNIEIHQPNDDRKRQFHKFFQQMMDEERYVFFK
ncbi:hypothetical protein WR25_06443 [Diploscapter pachys]|uniref:Methyltransferase FkbM domain-containing protein n=1 Tax=Diploscapter pachys TaxID=2018661 RepID=A0A2A2K901_9BILA|nr:hypothetical protein WR25_06443 [Diploscapter pachys]